MPKSIGAIGRGGFGWLWLAFGQLIKNQPKPTKTNHPLGLLNSPFGNVKVGGNPFS